MLLASRPSCSATVADKTKDNSSDGGENLHGPYHVPGSALSALHALTDIPCNNPKKQVPSLCITDKKPQAHKN